MLSINTILKNNKGFKWFEKDGLYVKGYIFDESNNYYSQEKLLEYFSNCNSKDDFLEKIKKANGLFSIIFIINDTVFLACDLVRMFPLFYSYSKNSVTDRKSVV